MVLLLPARIFTALGFSCINGAVYCVCGRKQKRTHTCTSKPTCDAAPETRSTQGQSGLCGGGEGCQQCC
jgi:hypothetical protein